MKGMVVFSLGWCHDEQHCRSNIDLARAAIRVINAQSDEVVIFCQRSVANVFDDSEYPEFRHVKYRVAKKRPGYEGSEDVMEQAAEYFREFSITEVIPVATPFIHMIKCYPLVKKHGFAAPPLLWLIRQIGWIHFDRKSAQPWTRSALALLIYTVRQVVFGYKGPSELSEP